VSPVAQVLQRQGHAGPVVEDDLSRRARPGQPVADRHHRQALAQLGPERRRRVHRLHDQRVHPLVTELAGHRVLPDRVAGGVQDQRVAVVVLERPADADAQGLLPEIFEGAAEKTDHAGPAAGQRAGDGIGLVTELIGGLAHAFDGLLGHLQAAQGVRDRRRRETGGLRHLTNRRSFPGLRHLSSLWLRSVKSVISV
jgi:hypothetical protein